MRTRVVNHLLAIPRPAKQALAVALDAIFCALATLFAIALRLETFPLLEQDFWLLVAFSWVVALPLLAVFGAYRAIFRYSGEWALIKISQAIGIYGLIYFSVVGVLKLFDAPRSLGIVQPVLLLGLVGLSRWSARRWLGETQARRRGTQSEHRVLIYGAGDAGRQLAESFGRSQDLILKGFVDDARELWGRSINGLLVYPPAELPALAAKGEITDIWLALPSLSLTQRQQVIDYLRPLAVHVRTLPSIRDLATGKVTLADLRELDLDELLARAPVEPKVDLLLKDIEQQCVLVTGAGGSIGSELCRQILRLNPRQLILFEQNEFGLYTIHQELVRSLQSHQPTQLSAIQMVPVLGSVTDKATLERVLDQFNPQAVFHAAAYKHVPLVESNPLMGIWNNVFGTLYAAQLAREHGVKSFVMVSTDKAVRPTNVMGASKRLAELCVQALAELPQPSGCRLSMVRFGNVLGSSGSVVPLFREQVKAGGPVTLTHKDVTRYFMSIPEAAQLVIQAGAMAKGGEVFVLDMGSPVKIYDLARRVIELSGRSVQDSEHPQGDIAIEVVGLRPGEKLYEELLIGDSPDVTNHPKVLKAREHSLPWVRLEQFLLQMQRYIDEQDAGAALELLAALVLEYRPERQQHESSGVSETQPKPIVASFYAR